MDIGLGGGDRIGFALIGSEIADELQDLRDIGGGGGADGQGNVI